MSAWSRAPAVPVKIQRSVLLFVTFGATVGCSAPPKEHAGGSARSVSTVASTPTAAPAPSASTAATAPADGTADAPAAPVGSADAPVARASSAYLGCGQPIPPDKLWDETTEGEVLEAISAAKTCAAANGRRLLLEFVAPWCDDCREMTRLDETSVVAQTLRARFERVRINVGKWDRHEGLRSSFDVRALATYIVIDARTSRQLAKTTLEPITKKGKKLSADDWARWLTRY